MAKRGYYRDLVVWQKSMEMVKEVYLITDLFPKSELYALTNQLRRAAVSVPSNIWEWNERSWNKDFHRFLEIAKWSCTEVSIQLEISLELWYITDELIYKKVQWMLEEIRRMLSWLQNKLL